MILRDPWAIAESVRRRAFRVRERVPIDDWCDAHRVVVAGNAEPGPWRTSRTPYLREPMLAMDDPAYNRVTLMMASQLGKTEAGFNGMLKHLVDDPGHWLAIWPNDKLARKVVKERIRRTIEAMPLYRGVFMAKRTQSSTTTLAMMNGSTVTAVGSGSSTNVRSNPIGKILIDEVDLCIEENDQIIQEAIQRTGTFQRSLIVAMGTPGFSNAGLHGEFLKSDQRRYEVPCPHCWKHQELVWRGVRWEGGATADPDEVERTAWYVCEHCGGVIENHHKEQMLANGVWVREGQAVRRKDDGTVELVGDVRLNTHAGFRLSSLYSPFKTFGWVARDFVEAKGFPPRVWFNGKLGQPWSPKGESLEVSELEKLQTPYTAGGHKLGTVPAPVLALTLAADVQVDHLWVVVEGWTEGGVDSHLVWAEKVESPAGGGLWQLDHVRRRTFQTADGRTLRIGASFVDSQYRTEEVFEYCRASKARGEHVIAVQGHDHLSQPHYAKVIEKTAAGRPLPGGVQLLHVNNAHWTESIWGQIQNSLRAIAGKAEERTDISRPAGRRYFPEDCPAFVLDHITAEAAIPRKRGGQVVVTWDLRPGRRDNHILDCLRYNAAGADWAGAKRLMRSVPAAPEVRTSGVTDPAVQRFRDRLGSRAV
jgi:phage terminase large subunit GpA-like protein